jgi:hypothetical protein
MSNLQKIDSIKGIEVDRTTYEDQLQMLLHYRAGMESLYRICKEQESKIPSGGPGVFTLYNASIPKDFYWLMPSYFQWFSVSACNYARLVAFLEGVSTGVFPLNRLTYKPNEKELVKNHCNSYMNSIDELKAVKQWRNKVAGHPALVDPSTENDLTRDASTFISHSIEEGRLLSKTFVSREMREGELVTDDLQSWSITKVFEELAPRFWPNILK